MIKQDFKDFNPQYPFEGNIAPEIKSPMDARPRSERPLNGVKQRQATIVAKRAEVFDANVNSFIATHNVLNVIPSVSRTSSEGMYDQIYVAFIYYLE